MIPSNEDESRGILLRRFSFDPRPYTERLSYILNPKHHGKQENNRFVIKRVLFREVEKAPHQQSQKEEEINHNRCWPLWLFLPAFLSHFTNYTTHVSPKDLIRHMYMLTWKIQELPKLLSTMIGRFLFCKERTTRNPRAVADQCLPLQLMLASVQRGLPLSVDWQNKNNQWNKNPKRQRCLGLFRHLTQCFFFSQAHTTWERGRERSAFSKKYEIGFAFLFRSDCKNNHCCQCQKVSAKTQSEGSCLSNVEHLRVRLFSHRKLFSVLWKEGITRCNQQCGRNAGIQNTWDLGLDPITKSAAVNALGPPFVRQTEVHLWLVAFRKAACSTWCHWHKQISLLTPQQCSTLSVSQNDSCF